MLGGEARDTPSCRVRYKCCLSNEMLDKISTKFS